MPRPPTAPARSGRSAPLLLALLLAAAPARSQPVAPPAAPAAQSQDAELFLEVSIDGRPTGLIVPATQSGAGLRLSVASLHELGLEPQRFGVAGREDFSLDEVPGLVWRYDPARQTLALELSDALRRPQLLSARSVRAHGPAQAGRGLVLNYDLHAENRGGGVAGAAELRYFDRHGTLSTSGSAVLQGRERGYLRYDTTWTRVFEDSLSSLAVGDTVTPALGWTRALRLGGVEWRRNFDLRPDLLTFPTASVQGSAVVPSSVSLYVNGVQQMQAEVPTGPFVIDQVVGLNGAGQATVVTRDALGRSVATTLPLYVDTRLLAAGLSDFALSAGALRRGYGRDSFRYGRAAALASWRHGWTDALTVEGHAEAGGGLAMAGAGILARVRGAGVANAALAASGGALRGWQASAGWQFIGPRFAFDLQGLRASRGFGDLGAVEGAPVTRIADRASLSTSLPGGHGLSASAIRYQAAGQPLVRTAALAYSRTLGRRAYLSLSAFQDLARRSERGVSATLSLALDGRVSMSGSAGRQRGARSASLALNRAPDFGGGVGWAVQAGQAAGQRYDQAQVQYLGSRGRAIVSTQRVGGQRSASLDASGALVLMDGALIAARQVGRGFALVSAGAPGLPVLQDNRPIGKTDDGGRLLVPDLVPHARNRIALDVSSLPADMQVRAASMEVTPREAAGVLARFAIERYAAASLVLLGTDGAPLAPGTPVRLDGAAAPSVVGYDGVVFVEGVGERNRLEAGSGEGACEVLFAWRPAAGELAALGPLVCRPLTGERR